MKRRSTIFICSALLAFQFALPAVAQTSEPSGPETLMADTRPIGNKPVFFGVSSRRNKRDEESALALENAAEQVSRYIEATGRADAVNRKTNEETNFAQRIDVRFDRSRIDELADRCTIIETTQDSKGTYVLAQFDEPVQAPISYAPKKTAGDPEWIAKPPVIPGYVVSVGSAQAKRLLADGVEAADESAFAEALRQIDTEIKHLSRARTVERAGTQIDSTSIESSAGGIVGFYVIARGISSDGRYVYSLAVCPESNLNER